MTTFSTSQSFQSVNGEIINNTITKTITDEKNQPALYYELEIFPGESEKDINSGFITFDILSIPKLEDINLRDVLLTILEEHNIDILVTQIDSSHKEKIEYLVSCGFIEVENEEATEPVVTLMFSDNSLEDGIFDDLMSEFDFDDEDLQDDSDD